MYDIQKRIMFLQKWILSPQDARKIGVLKKSKSALFGSVSHMAIGTEFTCMMNVRDQT